MYEHLYVAQTIAAVENERIERAAERRRFLAEHADQIVPRPAGLFRRMLRRLGVRPEQAARPVVARPACCEPTVAAAR